MRFSWFPLLLTLLVLAAGLFFGSPFAALLHSYAGSGGAAVLADREVLVVVLTSLVTALCATALATVVGIGLGYHFTFRRKKGGRLLKTFFSLPLVLPPSAATACWAAPSTGVSAFSSCLPARPWFWPSSLSSPR
jgi:ABC-type sulfate transport system permease component